MAEFHNTKIGRQFLDGTMPELVRTLKGIEKCLKEDLERRAQFEAVEAPILGPRGTELDLKGQVLNKAIQVLATDEDDLWSYIQDELNDVGNGTSMNAFMSVLKSVLMPKGKYDELKEEFEELKFRMEGLER